MKILLLTDSLSLPRIEPEYCCYEDTWPGLLMQNSNYCVHQVSIGGATSKTLLQQVHYHKAFIPDLVILQVGIVDCAPRFMTKIEYSIYLRLGQLGKRIIKFSNKRIIRKIRKTSFVSLQNFKNNITQIINTFGQDRCYILGIVPSSYSYETILPGITKQINQYNNFLKSFDGYISLDEVLNSNGLMTDHHHLNIKGHKIVFSLLQNKLNL